MFQEINSHGGRRPGAGRKKGSTGNSPRFSRALREETVKRAHAVLSSDMSPVDVMLRVMRGDEEITPRQYAAAVDVAPFVCPRLSAIAVAPLDPMAQLTPAQIDARLADLMLKHGPVIEGIADSSSATDQPNQRLSAPPTGLSHNLSNNAGLESPP